MQQYYCNRHLHNLQNRSIGPRMYSLSCRCSLSFENWHHKCKSCVSCHQERFHFHNLSNLHKEWAGPRNRRKQAFHSSHHQPMLINLKMRWTYIEQTEILVQTSCQHYVLWWMEADGLNHTLRMRLRIDSKYIRITSYIGILELLHANLASPDLIRLFDEIQTLSENLIVIIISQLSSLW